MASILGPHVTPHPNARRNHFEFLAGLLPDPGHLVPAGTVFLFLTDVVNCLYPRDLGWQRLPSALASAMGTNLDGLFIRPLATLRKKDFLSLVEQQKLAAVFLAELFRPTTEDPSSQKLNLLEMLQRFMLILDLLRTFLFKAVLEVANQILQFFNTTWKLSQFFIHPCTLS